ncbi:MAG TPA: dNTP triphosphohydrolase [Rhizobiaceae bacterium]|nr:dNTP triphosphohydrolase [Rhizobiaceae bacterium]
MKLSWQKLLSRARHRGRSNRTSKEDKLFTEHSRDVDRIIFSSSFRRLQGKAQLFTFPETDYVRNRLTHTLEAVSISRTLAAAIFSSFEKHNNEAHKEIVDACRHNGIATRDVVEIVAAATSAHDIGNAPFGHIGEYAIRSWFQGRFGEERRHVGEQLCSPDILNDYLAFDGNPQGFRVITKLEGWPEEIGGMQLTCATIAATVKYPWFSKPTKPEKGPSKFGFYASERFTAESIFDEVGLLGGGEEKKFFRHPLSYIMEAADDIAYLTSDLEDGLKYGLLDIKEVYELLRFITKGRLKQSRIDQARPEAQERIKLLRSAAIFAMITMCQERFLHNYPDYMKPKSAGKLSLMLSSESLDNLQTSLRSLVRDKIYYQDYKVRKEAAAFHTVRRLLDEFFFVIEDYFSKPAKTLNDKNRNMMRVMFPGYKVYLKGGKIDSKEDSFPENVDDSLRILVDFVSGMTDAYARNLCSQVSGRHF